MKKNCFITPAHPKYTKPQKGNKTDRKDAHKKEVEQEISRLAEPFSAVLGLIRTVPGLNANPMTTVAVLSEIGPDMSVFPTAKHLVSWARCCPRNDRSGNKVKSTRISRAGTYLKPLLIQVANALIKSKEHPEFKGLKAHRGHKKAIITVCKMLLTAIWNILSKVEAYTLHSRRLFRQPPCE